MDEGGQIRDSWNCLRSENIFLGCGIRPIEKAIGRRRIEDRVPTCSFLVRDTLQQFGQDWNKWNAVIETLPGRLVCRLSSPYLFWRNFIKLDFVAEESELRPKRLFFGKAAENFYWQHRAPFANQSPTEKPAINGVVVSQDLDVAGLDRLFNAISRNRHDRCRQAAQRCQRLSSEILVAHENTSSALDPADRNIQVAHDPFLEGADQFTVDHVMWQLRRRLSLPGIGRHRALDRDVVFVMVRVITTIVIERDQYVRRMPDHRQQMRLRRRRPGQKRALGQKMLMRHPPISERIRFGLGKILPDIRRRQVINLREKEFQPGVAGLLRCGDENAKVLRGHLISSTITVQTACARQPSRFAEVFGSIPALRTDNTSTMTTRFRPHLCLAVISCLLASACPSTAAVPGAVFYSVTSSASSGPGSLNDAVFQANYNGGDVNL